MFSGHQRDLLSFEHEQVDELVLHQDSLIELLLDEFLGNRQDVGKFGAAPSSHLLGRPQNIVRALSTESLRRLIPQHDVRNVLLIFLVGDGHLLDDLGAGATKRVREKKGEERGGGNEKQKKKTC